MSFAFIWNKGNKVWHIIISLSVKEKLQKLLSVNTETKRHLGYQIWHHLHKYTLGMLKGRLLVNDAIKGCKIWWCALRHLGANLEVCVHGWVALNVWEWPSGISRTTAPILGLFVLILMHFSCWIHITTGKKSCQNILYITKYIQVLILYLISSSSDSLWKEMSISHLNVNMWNFLFWMLCLKLHYTNINWIWTRRLNSQVDRWVCSISYFMSQ